MNKLFNNILLLFTTALFLSSCAGTEKAKSEKCPESFDYGSINFCLPSIDSMKNYYADTTIKSIADLLEFTGNSIEAIYFTDTVYKEIVMYRKMVNDNYIKIFTIDQLADSTASANHLEQVSNSIQTSNVFNDWNEIRMKLESGVDFITTGQPIYVDKYSPDPAVRSFVTLFKQPNRRQEEIFIGILNIMLIKEHLIGMNYYKKYSGAATFDQAKVKNDFIVKNMLNNN